MSEKKSVRQISDEQLHRNLMCLKSKESHIIACIVSHLEEVFRRRLFARHKCSSIYDYCIRVLGYSNGEAHRKISACKLATQCSEVKSSIAKGELSLSNAASVQVFLNQNKLGSEKAKNSRGEIGPRTKPLNPVHIINRVKNKSTRECEVELEKIAKENHISIPERRPRRRNFGEKIFLRVYLEREKVDLLKTRLNIKCDQELIEELIAEKLNVTAPKNDVLSRSRNLPSQRSRNLPSQRSRSISPSRKSIVFKRAQNKCENCGSKHYLQIDHRLSVAKGGSNNEENLRVLCRPCNQRAAIEQLGMAKMDRYIN